MSFQLEDIPTDLQGLLTNARQNSNLSNVWTEELNNILSEIYKLNSGFDSGSGAGDGTSIKTTVYMHTKKRKGLSYY